MTPSQNLAAPVVVIGGGIIGCATAYYLTLRGIRAMVVEQNHIACEASGRNAGGVRAQCRDRRERPLALASVKLWQTLGEELGMDLEYQASGNIRLANTESRLEQLAAEAVEEEQDGLHVELWDRRKLARRAPFLSDRFVGAKYCPTDGHANPIRATWAFAWAAQQGGAQIRPRTRATQIVAEGGRVTHVQAEDRATGRHLRIDTSQVVYAAGPWTGLLSESLGLTIPVRPIRLCMGVTERLPPLFGAFLSAHDLEVAARQAPSGHVHVSGFGEPEPTFDKRVPISSLLALHRVQEMVPRLAAARLLRTWAGLLAVTPDELPVIGHVPGLDGCLIAVGFSGHGFCLGPIVGKLLAEWLVDGQPTMDLTAFRPDRFTDPERAWQKVGGSSVIAGRLER